MFPSRHPPSILQIYSLQQLFVDLFIDSSKQERTIYLIDVDFNLFVESTAHSIATKGIQDYHKRFAKLTPSRYFSACCSSISLFVIHSFILHSYKFVQLLVLNYPTTSNYSPFSWRNLTSCPSFNRQSGLAKHILEDIHVIYDGLILFSLHFFRILWDVDFITLGDCL
jgi:hypothetical protein